MIETVPKINLRRMTLQDVPSVHDLDVKSFNLPWSERSFRYEVTENVNARPWVAEIEVDEKMWLAGMLVLWLILDEAHIATLAVEPEFRRQGIARLMLVEALKQAKAEGARKAYLEVRAGNLAAQEMYLKLGFEVVGRRPRYYHDNYEDALLMTLDPILDQPFVPGRQA